MRTRDDAHAHIETALGEHSPDFDVDAIADAIYDENGGTWDFAHFDTERFWEIAQANMKDGE